MTKQGVRDLDFGISTKRPAPSASKRAPSEEEGARVVPAAAPPAAPPAADEPPAVVTPIET